MFNRYEPLALVLNQGPGKVDWTKADVESRLCNFAEHAHKSGSNNRFRF